MVRKNEENTRPKLVKFNIEKEKFNVYGRITGDNVYLDIQTEECDLYGASLLKNKDGFSFIAPPSYKDGSKYWCHWRITPDFQKEVLEAIEEYDSELVSISFEEEEEVI